MTTANNNQISLTPPRTVLAVRGSDQIADRAQLSVPADGQGDLHHLGAADDAILNGHLQQPIAHLSSRCGLSHEPLYIAHNHLNTCPAIRQPWSVIMIAYLTNHRDPDSDLTGYEPLAVSVDSRLLVFSSINSWRLRVYDLQAGAELVNDDDTTERFWLDDDEQLVDSDLGTVTPLRFVGGA